MTKREKLLSSVSKKKGTSMGDRKKCINVKTAPAVHTQNNVKRQTKPYCSEQPRTYSDASGSDRKSRKYPGSASKDEQIHSGRRYLWYHEKRPVVQKNCPKRNKICIA